MEHATWYDELWHLTGYAVWRSIWMSVSTTWWMVTRVPGMWNIVAHVLIAASLVLLIHHKGWFVIAFAFDCVKKAFRLALEMLRVPFYVGIFVGAMCLLEPYVFVDDLHMTSVRALVSNFGGLLVNISGLNFPPLPPTAERER